ncbi:MAG: FHA domain-containing protein [Gemmataceae bacterium]
MPPPRKPFRPPPAEMEGTRLESSEEILQALAARRAGRATDEMPALPVPPLPVRPAPVTAVEPADVQPERPTQRPPMALLCVLDDGRPDGELIRLRAERTMIGRTEGDIRIAHDGQISSRHAEIVRQRTASGWRWLLTDLGSTNGVYVRVGSSVLRDGYELMVGQGRYRFELPDFDAGGETQAGGGRDMRPTLVEVTAAGPLQRFPLVHPELWIGRDPRACAIARPEDALVSPRHARVYRTDKGWHVENHRSFNGLWLRVEQVALGDNCQFRLGEQRFLFRVL